MKHMAVRQNAQWRSALYDDMRSASFVRPSQSERLVYLKNGWHRITKFHTDINTDPLYSQTGYNVTSYFHSQKIARKNCRKCRLRWLRVEFLENGISEDQKILYQLLPVRISGVRKNGRKCPFNGFWSNFRGETFCLAQPNFIQAVERAFSAAFLIPK